MTKLKKCSYIYKYKSKCVEIRFNITHIHYTAIYDIFLHRFIYLLSKFDKSAMFFIYKLSIADRNGEILEKIVSHSTFPNVKRYYI